MFCVRQLCNSANRFIFWLNIMIWVIGLVADLLIFNIKHFVLIRFSSLLIVRISCRLIFTKKFYVWNNDFDRFLTPHVFGHWFSAYDKENWKLHIDFECQNYFSMKGLIEKLQTHVSGINWLKCVSNEGKTRRRLIKICFFKKITPTIAIKFLNACKTQFHSWTGFFLQSAHTWKGILKWISMGKKFSSTFYYFDFAFEKSEKWRGNVQICNFIPFTYNIGELSHGHYFKRILNDN